MSARNRTIENSVLLAKQDARGAAQAVAEALKAEPDNAEALELKRKIR